MIKLKYDTDLNLLIDTINVIKVKDNRYSFDKNNFKWSIRNHPQSPIPNPQSPVKMFKYLIDCFQKY